MQHLKTKLFVTIKNYPESVHNHYTIHHEEAGEREQKLINDTLLVILGRYTIIWAAHHPKILKVCTPIIISTQA